jgi:hypothetical protein
MTMHFLNSDWFRRLIASSNRTTCPPRNFAREVNKSHVAVRTSPLITVLIMLWQSLTPVGTFCDLKHNPCYYIWVRTNCDMRFINLTRKIARWTCSSVRGSNEPSKPIRIKISTVIKGEVLHEPKSSGIIEVTRLLILKISMMI